MGAFEIHGNAKRTVNYDVAVIGIDFVASEKIAFAASSKVMEYCERFLAEVKRQGLILLPSLFRMIQLQKKAIGMMTSLRLQEAFR